MADLALVGVEERIATLVGEHRAELEHLVRQAVDRELAELVDAEVDRAGERLAYLRNGATPAPELCADCGERPRLPARTVCGTCKARRERRTRRRVAPVDDAQEPASDAPGRPDDAQPIGGDARAHSASQRAGSRPSGAPGRFRYDPAADEREQRERRRATIAQARANGVETVERDGRTYELVRLEPGRVTARDLAERNRRTSSLSAGELEAWLVREHLADVDGDGTLHPTARAIELADGLA